MRMQGVGGEYLADAPEVSRGVVWQAVPGVRAPSLPHPTPLAEVRPSQSGYQAARVAAGCLKASVASASGVRSLRCALK